MAEPTFWGELKRGVNLFNLSVGIVTSVTVAGLMYTFVPEPLFALGRGGQALAAGATMMFLTTGLHTAGHAYFGWRFERGIQASRQGEHDRAIALLSVVEKKEMDHFDPEGHALTALRLSREALTS